MLDPQAHWQSTVLPWQQAALDQLMETHHAGRLPHALVLVGSQGAGAELFAAGLAARLLCQQEAGRPCGECESCQVARGGGHGDYRWLAPEEGKRAIGIDAVRASINFLQQTAAYGGLKLLVVTPAEAMTAAAANALLKTLEEPAGDTLVVLTSARPGELPATIRSRCQQLRLPLGESQAQRQWLDQAIPEAARLDELLVLCDGRVIEALALAQGDGVNALLAQQGALRGLLLGELSAGQVLGATADMASEQVLSSLLNLLMIELRRRAEDRLILPQRAVDLHQELQKTLSALHRGGNLARDLLLRDVFRQVAGCLR